MYFPLLVGARCVYSSTFVPSQTVPSLAVSYPYIYSVSETEDTLKIFDASSRASPVLVSNTSVGAGKGPRNPRLVGTKLYVPCRNSLELQIWDVSNPGTPSLLGSCSTTRGPQSVAVNGTTACCALGPTTHVTQQLIRIDVSNAAAPTFIDYLNYNAINDFQASWIETYGTHFFATLGRSPDNIRLVSWNVSGGAKTGDIGWGSIGTTVGHFDITSDGTHAFVARGGNSSLVAVDISDPTNLTETDSISNWGATSNNSNQAVAYRDLTKHVYWGHFNGVDVQIWSVDATDPTNLSSVGYISTGSLGTESMLVEEGSCQALIFSVANLIYLQGQPAV